MMLVRGRGGAVAFSEKTEQEGGGVGPRPVCGRLAGPGARPSAPSPLPQHKYTSIAEVQAQMEEEYLRSPLSGVSQEPFSASRVPTSSQALC